MLRRTANAVFGAGMYVFPGGRVDAIDGAADVGACVPRSRRRRRFEATRPGIRRALLLDGGGARGIRGGGRAARRAHRRRSADARPRRTSSRARRVAGGRRSLCSPRPGDRSVPDCTTSITGSRRSANGAASTRGSSSARCRLIRCCVHDDAETVDSLWVRPAEAVAMFGDGRAHHDAPHGGQPAAAGRSCLAWPTRSTAAAAIADPPRIEPKLRFTPEGKVIGVALPWDDDYDEIPPPTR